MSYDAALGRLAGRSRGDPTSPRHRRDALTAYETWPEGEADGALRTFERVESSSSGWGTEGAVLRLWMGQIDAQQGRTADADAAFASLEQRTVLGWYGLLLQARLHRDAGDADAAKGAYGRFL